MEKWYVIQTRVNDEEKLVELINKMVSKEEGLYQECFVPRYENVWRLKGFNLILVECMFRGYVFVITEHPEELFIRLKSVPKLSKILGEVSDDGGREFIPLSDEEQTFMENILDPSDYVVHRSLVHRNAQGRIDMAKGPLVNYVDKIVKVDNSHRRIFVELELFGKVRRIKFCFMTDEDCRIENKELPEWEKPEFCYQPGDIIKIDSEAYLDQEFEIKKIDEKKRTVTVEVDMFGNAIEMIVDSDHIIKIE